MHGEDVLTTHNRMKGLVIFAVLLSAVSCGHPSTGPDVSPEACRTDPEINGRQVLEFDALVGKIGTTGCDGVGGTPVTVSHSGRLYARSTWSDPHANLKIEIWRGPFEELLITALKQGSDLCVSSSISVSAGLYVVVTCHTADSAVPLSSPVDSSTFTPHHL